jgi:hypothetical protein
MQEWLMPLGLLRLRVSASVFLLCCVPLASCSSESSICDELSSVAGFTIQFSQGLDNFSETQFESLKNETFAARDSVNHVAVTSPDSTEAADLAKKLNVFISAMEKNDWDVSVAQSDAVAVDAARNLGSPKSLTQANTVESLLIAECGLPSTIANSDLTSETLPGPSVPSPTQTDPPTNTINEDSQDSALGSTVASLFNLTVSPSQAVCLGRTLQGVVDVSSSTSNLAQYQSQFQRAFDECGIIFTVPRN